MNPPIDLSFYSSLPNCDSQLLLHIMNKIRKFVKKEMFDVACS